MVPGRTQILTAIGLLLTLVGCGGDKGVRAFSDFELAERHAQCLDRQPTAPGSVQACKNIAQECERRKEDLGLYVCRSH